MQMIVMFSIIFIVAILFSQSASINKNNTFELSIIHINDFHVRFEPTHSSGKPCKGDDERCLGGFSRLYSSIQKLKGEHDNAIILNAGDSFFGTLWYTFYRWKAVAHFLNKINFDAHAFGNHEFDDRIIGVVPLLRHLHAPILAANIDDINEPTIRGLFKKSIVIKRNGKKIGIVGVITAETKELSSPEGLVFLNESESVNQEALRLVTQENVDTIIVLSHCGYNVDKHIARNAAPKISLIVGGHSHSLLYNGIGPRPLEVDGPYPTVVDHIDGRNILIVQASAFSRFVGNITIYYKEDGSVLNWSGKPVYLEENSPTDSDIDIDILEWKIGLDSFSNAEIGKTQVHLDSQQCHKYECNFGNLVADSMMYANQQKVEQSGESFPCIAFVNAGAFQKSIDPGPITVAGLLDALPHLDTVDMGMLQGKYINEALEHVTLLNSDGNRRMLQSSGLKVVYNMTNAPGFMVESVKVRCADCNVPTYDVLNMENFYRVAISNFLGHGGDGFVAISNNIVNYTIGEDHFIALQRYIAEQSPIRISTEGRILVFS